MQRGAVRVRPTVRGAFRVKGISAAKKCQGLITLFTGRPLFVKERGDLMGKKREEFRCADSSNRSSFSSPALGTDGW